MVWPKSLSINEEDDIKISCLGEMGTFWRYNQNELPKNAQVSKYLTNDPYYEHVLSIKNANKEMNSGIYSCISDIDKDHVKYISDVPVKILGNNYL